MDDLNQPNFCVKNVVKIDDTPDVIVTCKTTIPLLLTIIAQKAETTNFIDLKYVRNSKHSEYLAQISELLIRYMTISFGWIERDRMIDSEEKKEYTISVQVVRLEKGGSFKIL
ncbi:MAG: hypothetical protein KKD44_29255 [Proteobacteria bacterium]|nr:hypothetical protein [Pseudomonadota bacterium]